MFPKNKIKMFDGFWDINDCKTYSNSLFLYGDNDVKFGYGGQAVIRSCKNALGIPTKKCPNNVPTSFYTDNEYYDNCIKILNALTKIIDASLEYDYIIFPEDGFGTGLSCLPTKAPKTLKFINRLMKQYFGVIYL